MARTATRTAVSLVRYAQVMGLSQVHFHHLDDGAPSAMRRAFWTQAHHDQLADALANAEAMLRVELGFDVAPRYRTVTVPFRPPQKARLQARSGLTRAAAGPGFWDDLLTAQAWQFVTVQAPDGYLVAFGAERKTLAQAGATVVYAGDVGTVTVAAIGTTDPAEVAVFYRVADGADAAGDDAWRIAGVEVAIAAGTATITAPKSYFVLPAVMVADEPADYTDADNFVTAVDVYRVDTDEETPVTVYWDSHREVYGGDPAASLSDTAVGYLTDPQRGEFHVRTADYSGGAHVYRTPAYAGLPARFALAYLAGYPLGDSGDVHPLLEQAVIRLANTLLPEPFHWLLDAAKTWGDDRAAVDGAVIAELGLSPFGATQGAYQAWAIAQQVKRKGLHF